VLMVRAIRLVVTIRQRSVSQVSKVANTGLTFEPDCSWAARVLQYDRDLHHTRLKNDCKITL